MFAKNSRTTTTTATLLLTLLAGCRETESDSPDVDRAGRTPTQLVQCIHEARMSGQLGLLSGYMRSGDASLHVPVILALDQVLLHNSRVQTEATRRFGPSLVQKLDLSPMGDSYGILSRRIKVVSQQVIGESATVVVQEGDHVPLLEVRLTRPDGHWVAETELPEPKLAERLQALAHALEQAGNEVQRDGCTFMDLEHAYHVFVDPALQAISAEG